MQSGKFEEVMAEMLDWLDECVPRLEADVRSECQMGDVDTVHALLADHYKEVTDVLKAKRPNLYELRKRAAQIADGNEGDEAEVVEMRRQMADVDDKWKRLEVTASKKVIYSNVFRKAPYIVISVYEARIVYTHLS